MFKSLALALLGCAVAHASPIATNVHDQGVTYQGIYANEVEGFIGIYYGQDTGGNNRFRPPVPYTPAAGTTIDANVPGPACPQRVVHGTPNPFNAYEFVTSISENCLSLNIWRPNGTNAGDDLPVLLYIHGGGFITGSKDGVLSQPGGMILQSIDNGHPIIHVEINYRLNVFGFAQTDALIDETSANAGIRDQRLSIEWVKDNIAAFGGNPDQITIHGQSSGGLAMGMQILAYGATKPVPFQQIICESQALENAITGNTTRHSMYRVWLNTNCTHLDFDSAESAQCLREQPMETLVEAQIKTHVPGPPDNDGDAWLPVVDGDFVPEAPSTLLAAGKFANVSAIIGWCDNDYMLFVPTDIRTPHGTYEWIRKYLPGFTDANVHKLLSLYPSSEFETKIGPGGGVEVQGESYRTGRIARDILFTCQPIYIGQVLAEAGNPVYLYNQNYSHLFSADLNHAGDPGLGVVHTSELIYVFGNLSKYDYPDYPYNPTSEDEYLRVHESRSWSSFTALGKPTVNGLKTLPAWSEADFTDENYGVYVIGGPHAGYSGPGGILEAQEIMAAEKLQERCGFLNSPEIIKQLQY